MFSRCRFRFAAIIAVCLATLAASARTDPSPVPLTLGAGYRQMYNLDFADAHKTFLQWQHDHPQDPMGFVSNAAAYLFSEFNRLHILEVDLFTDDSEFEARKKLAPDLAVKAAFKDQLAKSDQLADAVLAKSPQDTNALFAKILAGGLRGDYAALIEKRDLASLSYMKHSRILADQLLQRDPTCYDAYLAVGVENYLLGIDPAPIRWFLSLTGAQPDKAAGIYKLELTAIHGHYLAPFARLLLAVAAIRDKNLPKARSLLQGLASEFPKNPLYAHELARISH